ncbi:MAG: 3-phosphoglycerate dehydrogenase [Clostridia bacterium]|nr:3-phosphoglycerate dehydrogenase [Clostridia bacterium]MBO7400541.1 3-phosphoglycerate dehydrogenase [Clostridia bacterium]MBO7548709.1 3-phosphoglycerate dehydrogenase [Clostridia bacterium]MBP5238663.1 3-phosphoglycerate dehydrogenase [Clostridia bacterium]
MTKIKLYNKIDKAGINRFDTEKYELGEDLAEYEGIMVRSAALHDVEFPSSLRAIARAGAGVNNIPIDKCADEGIVVFNTPGANANGVKELSVAALLLASRDIAGGIEWCKSLIGTPDIAKQVEKGKSAFAGPELLGKTLGVIGLGAIGGMVANTATSLGMTVIGCDPYITVNAAWSISRAVIKANAYDEVYAASDYITIHVPSNDSTRGMINADAIAKMKDGVRIINLARGDLVNAADLKAALDSGKVASYVTDFPDENILGCKNTVCIPHLGASTPESEENCARMAADELIDFFENGNIRNSVNYPAISQPRSTAHRIIVLHKNIPSMVASVSAVLGADKVNIDSMSNRSKGNYAVTIIDPDSEVTPEVAKDISDINGVIRVNIIA